MQRLFTVLLLFLSAFRLTAQISFTNRADLLGPVSNHSGVAIAVLDMNGDGRDDVVRLQQGRQLNIAYQTAPNKPFELLLANMMSNESQWGMCAGDVDNNGYPDVLSGGSYDQIKVARADATGQSFTVSTLMEPSTGTFVQTVNFADINNDGWLDAFVCHDDGVARIFMNDGAGNLLYNPMVINLATYPTSDNSGNYGSVWSDIDNDGDLDLYIAHCRQGVNNPADPRRINQLFLNNGDGTYTQDTANTSGLRIGAQSWTADFGDIDNDGDFDCFITNHDVTSQLLENDGAGHFTDITAAAGLNNAIQGLPIQGVFRDFDNDGYVDIVVAGSSHYLFRNNGDKTFDAVAGLFDANPMESFAIGDLNHDGFQDIYGGYAEIYTDPTNIPDALWLNDGNDNHFFGLTLRGVQSNRSAVGAKVRVFTPAGMQTREARAGESYGIMNSLQIHVGLGDTTAIDSVVVYWPSGTVDVLVQPAADQYHTLVEGGCHLPQISLTAQGATTFCTGDSVALEAPAGYSYVWSTGDTTATLAATAGGLYRVTVTAAAGCTAISDAIALTVDPVEVPTIATTGDSTFCVGGSVTLTSSPAASYIWSTGDTTQSITVSEAGAYSVAAEGLCSFANSTAVTVEVLDPGLPVVTNDTILAGELATLTATGDSLVWYDAPVGGNVVFVGNAFDTLGLTESLTLWVENVALYDQPDAHTGMPDHMGTNFNGSTFNGEQYFDAYEPFRLVSVKVYTAIAGERKFDLRDAAGTVLATTTVNVPADTVIVELNFDVPAGQGLVLTTDVAVNQANFNSNSPRLRRSDSGVLYPYTIPGTLSITGSNGGGNFYYYFYDWVIDFRSFECHTPRVAATVEVDSISAAPAPTVLGTLRLFPNPASTALTVELQTEQAGTVAMRLFDARGAIVRAAEWPVPGSRALHVDGLARGAYWLELSSATGTVRRKVVVQ
jgi:hypothetical protein